MDFKEIDKILDKYFEGLTSLEEEKLLQKYFTSNTISKIHKPFKAMFDSYDQNRHENNPLSFQLNNKPDKRRKKYYITAVALIIVLSTTGGILQQYFLKEKHLLSNKQVLILNNHLEKKKEALKEIKKFTKNVNDGIKKANAISIFGEATEKIFNLKNEKK